MTQSARNNAPQGGRPGMGPGMGRGPGRGGPGGPMGARVFGEKPKETKKTLLRLLRYIGHSRTILYALLAITLAVAAIDVLGPALQQRAIDTISITEGHIRVDFSSMLLWLGLMAGMYLVSALISYVQARLSARLSQDTVYVMRNDLFKKISHLPIAYTDTHRHGDIMSRMTNDVENVSMAVSQSVTTLFSGVLTLTGVTVMMLLYSPLMTLIAVLTVPVTLFLSSMLAKYMRRFFTARQELLGRMNGQVEEMVTGYRTVVAYGKEGEALSKFGKTSDEFRKCSISARVWGSVMGPLMNFVGNFQYVLLAGVGGAMMLAGRPITIGTIQAMLQYSKKFTFPINMIANQYSTILTALAGAERIFAILDGEDEVDKGTLDVDVKSLKGDILFEDVDFSYVPGEKVLRDLDLHVLPGQKIAIVGATGSGKTTIVNLLMRFYEPDSGRILVDGTDIRDVPKSALRSAIAIVLQDTVLFNDTIRANIKYGRLEASDEDMKRAADVAMASSFIDRLPEGYDTVLAEAGSNLSQGQRQLLSITRAVLADPQILILDEATSSVDTRTEMYIQQAMVNLMKGRTSLIIAHRLSTIRDADVIVVLKGGVIMEAGSHDELLAAGGEYWQLYNKQFAGVET